MGWCLKSSPNKKADKENSIKHKDQRGVSFTLQSLVVVPGIRRGLLTLFFTQNQERLSATPREKERRIICPGPGLSSLIGLGGVMLKTGAWQIREVARRCLELAWQTFWFKWNIKRWPNDARYKGRGTRGVFGFVISQFKRAKPNLVIMVVNYGRNNGSLEGGVSFSQGSSRRFSGFAGVTASSGGGGGVTARRCAAFTCTATRAHTSRGRERQKERDRVQ